MSYDDPRSAFQYSMELQCARERSSTHPPIGGSPSHMTLILFGMYPSPGKSMSLILIDAHSQLDRRETFRQPLTATNYFAAAGYEPVGMEIA